MNICRSCGVELEDNLERCPLCGRGSGDLSVDEMGEGHYPSDIIHQYRNEKRKYIWELSGVIAFSGITVCTIVDLVINKVPRWSIFADVSLLSAWSILTNFLLALKRTLILIPGLMATILVMLLIFDLLSPGPAWFLPVGLPITLAAFTALSLVVLFYKIAHFEGFNLLAIIFLLTGGFCIAIEFIINRFMSGKPIVHWSLIAAVSIFPIALVLFFLHYRMKKGRRLDSFFHV